MPILHDNLHDLTVDDLKKRLALLGVKLKAPRKAELISALQQFFSGSKLASTWNSLSSLEQTALQETCYTADFTFNPARIAAKYGRAPALTTANKSNSTWDHSGFPTQITLFLFTEKYRSGYFIPYDLAIALRKLVPAPASLTIVPLPSEPKEEGLTIRQTEHDALREVTSLLRLAEQGSFLSTPKTGMPSASGKKAILASLSAGDFFPPEIAYKANKESWGPEIGAIKPIGWVRLFLAAKLVSAGGSRSRLTPAGVKALSTPTHDITRLLWKKWLANIQFDEFNRIDDILGQKAKGHMTAKPPRRHAIADALSECPTNEWIDIQKFSSFMQAENFTFEVSRDPWKLYIADREYGALGYDGFGGWNILQFRYLLVLLFEYAATLGMIDIAYRHPSGALDNSQDNGVCDGMEWLSRYDGLRAYRITNLGAYCLGLTEVYEPTQPESSLQLTVSAKLTIQLLSDDIPLSERMLIETWATPIKDGLWQIDPSRTREAIERGNRTEDFLAFLDQCDDKPRSQRLERFLKTALNDAQALKRTGDAIFFDCRDPQTADMLLQQKPLKGICFRCSDTRLVIPADKLQKFQKHIRKIGLGFA